MYTQCPNCRTIFEIDEDVLQASLGIVACGNCGQRFDALRSLSDRVPSGPDPTLPERDPEASSPILTQRVAPRADTAGSPSPTPSGVAHEPAPAAGPLGDARLTARAGARARALIAEAAGIPRDAILEDPAWQVTELPVLTAIILHEPISPADLDDAAAMLGAEGEAAGMRAGPGADAGSSPGFATAETAAPDETWEGVITGPGIREPDAASTGPPTSGPDAARQAGAREQGAATATAIPTTAFLRIEDVAEPAAGPPEAPEDQAAAEKTAASAPEPDAGVPDSGTTTPGMTADAAAAPEPRSMEGGALDPPTGDGADAGPFAAAAASEPGSDSSAAAGEPGPQVDAAAAIADPAAMPSEPVYVPPATRRIRRRELLWLLGCAALTLALAAQLAWAQRAAFVRDPATRQSALRVCRYIACHLPPIRDVAELALVSRDIRPDPKTPGVLSITATLRNDAPFRQPWPVVVVRMTDIDDRVVAMRRFHPAEYLPGAARRAVGIPPGTTAAVALEVRDPGRRATGFRFDFE